MKKTGLLFQQWTQGLAAVLFLVLAIRSKYEPPLGMDLFMRAFYLAMSVGCFILYRRTKRKLSAVSAS
jgi:hypothetical protein